VITIQRVRVRWSAAARDARHADVRRGLCRPLAIPSTPPTGDVVIHEMVADESAEYERREQVGSGDLDRARDLDLWLTWKGSTLVVDKMPGRAAYPRQSGQARLFQLQPGQVGRYRANFRYTFSECACNPSWF
jgi:hypothetical protein